MNLNGVAVWPETARHHYLQSLYSALSAQGVPLSIDGVPIDMAFLRSHVNAIGALHLHWPEHFWGRRGEYPTLGRMKRLVQLSQFVRLAKALKLPVVWTVHNLDRHEGSDVLDRIGVRLIARSASLIVCHTEAATTEVARRYGLDHSRLVVMRMGSTPFVNASSSRAETLRALALSPERRTLLCFGLVRRYKGFDLAIHAARRLGEHYQLIIAGSPLDETIARDLRKTAGSAGNIRFVLNYMPEQEVANLFASCDAVVLPYRRVTGSAVLLSAFSAARGVVASDGPFFREMIAPEPEAGELFETGNVDALTQAIQRYFATTLDRRHAAAERLSQLYAWQHVTGPVAERLRALLTSRTLLDADSSA